MSIVIESALIIDDDPLFHTVAEAALRDCGASSVSAAEDGLSGLESIRSNPTGIDLVLCDLEMPGMDGAKLIRELANIGFAGKIVIVSGTELGLRESVFQMAKLANANVVGALGKPLVLNELKALLSCQQLAPDLDEIPVARECLTHALESGELKPFFQPKVDLSSLQVTGFEVLCRHVSHDKKVSPPMPFIRSAMCHSMIGSLTRCMIEQTIEQTANWQGTLGDFGLAINMSPACILNPELPDRLTHKFKSAGIDPSRVTFEVTEDRLMEEQSVILEVLSRLRLCGFNLSLDDFGTGAASIEQIRRFPFNELKIDRGFVANASSDEFSRLTVQAAVKLASLRGVKTVAEGVETESTLQLMKRMDISEAQGFFFAPALPASEVLDWVSDHHAAYSSAA